MSKNMDKTRCSTTSEQDTQPSVERLLAKLEAAPEGSPDLDLEIAMLLHGDWLRANCEWTDEGWVHRQYGKVDIEARQFTRSLDDAVSLMPIGWWWIIGAGKTRPDEPLYGASIYEPVMSDITEPSMSANGEHSASAALAVCIAALRARQASPQIVAGTDAQTSNTDTSINTTVATPETEPGR